jgi:hypothetical protein
LDLAKPRPARRILEEVKRCFDCCERYNLRFT